ncbi:putative ion transport protein [Trypanosoma grayi]|uniref:putative ion transport protein n=1 Tax=Trypanosoma grayi TaxID=71804 RepID=UPI0004F44A21|nr:putative ion transport protein [Trypanosoma grayi]KEG08733.1 putative ion transport protein [Trypanosoma grayi]
MRGAKEATVEFTTTTTTPVTLERQQQKRRDHGDTLKALRRKTRAVTMAPRLLGTRVKHLLRDEFYIDVGLRNAPSVVTKEIVSLELLAAYHCWLRGVQALLAVIVFVLSLMRSDTIVDWTILGISEAAVLIILKVYAIKAEYTSLTNVMYERRRNIFTSPFLGRMLLEVVVWNIQTPPVILFWRPFFELLNYFMFIRLYAVVVYIHNAAYVRRSFCRAMAAVVALPLNIGFTVRTALVYRSAKTACLTTLLSWLAISCMYTKAEGVPLRDGCWYAFQTISTIGYGDITPVTTAGRLVTVLAWVVSFILIAYLVVVSSAALADDANEHNMYMLMRCHKLSNMVRHESARVIQTAWRFRRANRRSPVAPATMKQRAKALFYSWSLTGSITKLRRVRQDWVDATQRFRASSINPATGLSEYQHYEQLRHAQRAARQAQRQIDVDIFVEKLVRGRDREPTREEVERAIFDANPDIDSFKFASDVVAGVSPLFGPAAVSVPPPPADVDTEGLLKRVEDLENVCSRLSAMIESLSATAVTNPPSLAQSYW